MKKIVVISDSHNMLPKNEAFWQILEEADYIFHLGDGKYDIQNLKEAYKDKLYFVYGNCDLFSSKSMEIVQIENVKMLLTHGHNFKVKSDLFDLAFECEYQNVKYGLYGHTHKASIDVCQNGVTLINPGSIAFTNSYCYIIINDDKLIYKLVQI